MAIKLGRHEQQITQINDDNSTNETKSHLQREMIQTYGPRGIKLQVP